MLLDGTVDGCVVLDGVRLEDGKQGIPLRRQ